MKLAYSYFIILSAVVLFLGCKGDDDLSNEGPQKGDAFGYLTFLTQGGNQIVKPEGFSMTATNLLDKKVVPVMIDETGKFTFQAMPMGEYEINPALAGYKPMKVSYYHLGGEAPGYIGNIRMMEISTTIVELKSFRYETNYYGEDLVVQGKVTKSEKYDSNYYRIRLVFGNDQNTLSSTSYLSTTEGTALGPDFEIKVPYYQLNKYKFVRAYSDNLGGYCEYVNYPQSSTCTFSTIGPASNILSLE
jgi:hypothetical protein